MRKKEIRWISRDGKQARCPEYACWVTEPTMTVENGPYFGKGYIYGTSKDENDLGIELIEGGLAKVTIERQY